VSRLVAYDLASSKPPAMPIHRRERMLASVYENDPEDLAELGWERFVSDVWASIYVGYSSNAGIRTICRRWSDLLQGGLGCSQELADELVRTQVFRREDRWPVDGKDALGTLRSMDQILAGIGMDLAELDGIRPAARLVLLEEHKRLREFFRESSEPGLSQH
jgi:hypothetical protein